MATIFQTTLSNAFSWKENVWILIKISLKFDPECPINNIPTLDQIMAWRLLIYWCIYTSLGLNEWKCLITTNNHYPSAGLGSNTFYQIQIQILFFPELQIQIQIQIHRQKFYQIQIQKQIQLIKYKYKYKCTMRPRQNCRHFIDDILKFIVL